jgi:hypothetical protein
MRSRAFARLTRSLLVLGMACDDRGVTLEPDSVTIDAVGDAATTDADPDASNPDAGTSCLSTNDCPLDTVCDRTCVADGCTSAADCPSAHACPIAGPAGAGRHCGATCSGDPDCRAEERCKGFPSGRSCARSGSLSAGSACASFADCAAESACLDWPGGYCAEAGCTDNADCANGTWCVAGLGVCALACVSVSCREAEGYSCTLSPTLGGIDRFVCVP